MSEQDSNPPEGFRVIPDYPRYAIDENGIVLSICIRGGNRKAVLSWSNAKRASIRISHHGYKMIILHGTTGKDRSANIHTLVLEAFVGPRPDGLECRHIDGNKLNNHLSNLVWGTSRENNHDKKQHGTLLVGSKNPAAKLTNADVLEIRRRRASGEKCKSIADDFNISDVSVSYIAKRITWQHI